MHRVLQRVRYTGSDPTARVSTYDSGRAASPAASSSLVRICQASPLSSLSHSLSLPSSCLAPFSASSITRVIFVDIFAWANQLECQLRPFTPMSNAHRVYVGSAEYYNKVPWNDRKVHAANNSLSQGRQVGRCVLGFGIYLFSTADRDGDRDFASPPRDGFATRCTIAGKGRG